MKEEQKMKTFEAYEDGTLIVDMSDGMIMKIMHDKEGITYLCSDKSAWPAWQFEPEDFSLHFGNLESGDIDIGWKRK